MLCVYSAVKSVYPSETDLERSTMTENELRNGPVLFD
jgi:hypothetical protein